VFGMKIKDKSDSGQNRGNTTLKGSVSGWPEGAGSGTRSTYFSLYTV
jgi:hypothetical protein